MNRAAVAMIAVLGVTAFAPAPLPRSTPRRSETITLQSLQGGWKVARIEAIETNGARCVQPWAVSSIRVEGAGWTHLDAVDMEMGKYRLAIDGKKSPATIDWYALNRRKEPTAEPFMVGIIRRKGDGLEILYWQTEAKNRARSFDNPPAHWWVLTLQRRR